MAGKELVGEPEESTGGGRAKVTYVGMVGVVDVRRIDKNDWKAINVTDGKLREWTGDWENPGRTIEDDFSAGELSYLESDSDFKVTRI